MTWELLVGSALLAAVAAAGVLRPFGRPGNLRLEPAADPLEEEKEGLLRSLRDLDEERAMGALRERDYLSLRRDTQLRTVAVLRALEARGVASDMDSSMKDLRRPSPNGSSGPHARAGARLRIASILAMLALTVAVVVPLLVHAEGPRGAGQAITGDSTGSAGPPLSFFEKRVREHPNDVAARLDLAARYRNEGLSGLAVAQYAATLRLDPRNVEAHTELGLILYGQGRAADGLHTVRQALSIDPSYPEALYAKGLILWEAMHRYSPAAAAFRAYLAAAPYGAHREQVQHLLAMERQISPSPEPSPR